MDCATSGRPTSPTTAISRRASVSPGPRAVPVTDARRLCFAAGNLFAYESGGIMRQNILMANFNTRFSRNVSLFGNYQFNHTMDLPGTPTDPYNFAQDWARSSLERRHRFQLVGSVVAPLGI